MLTAPILLGLAATTATAFYHEAIHPGALAAKRDLVARQSSTDSGASAATSCLSGLLSIYSSLPTPPPAIVSWEESATFTDPCSITIPASISAEFSSYESQALSWFTAHSSELYSALSQCPQYSSVAGGAGDSAPPVCTAGTGGGSGSGSGSGAGTTTTTDASTTTTKTSGTTSATGSGSGSSAGSSSTTSAGAASTQSKNAGPRETGFVAGAVAVAGFLGVVAAL
ncbi:hypothetical protein BR93DRAFT_964984 [Coniochaeta sp. PMI_546]|nr:hypothetical protein BR93DRAFT_964984 [Coniochaeta sp. PMI_546]